MRTPFVALLLILSLVLPAAAVAQVTPGDDIYDPADKKSTIAVSASDPGDPGDPGGGLPFTGLDVGLVVLAGGAVLGTGLALRRATRTD